MSVLVSVEQLRTATMTRQVVVEGIGGRETQLLCDTSVGQLHW